MKYCPQNKNHKNPNNAIYCSECGSKLIEQETITNNKICTNCHHKNPNNAIYCSECGNKLLDIDNKVELTVYSNIICDAILLCGTVQCIRNTSKAIFKIEANSNVDILFDCDGKRYRKYIFIDNSPSKIVNVEFGTINIFSYPACQIKMSGRNMDCSLIKSGNSNTKIKALYGIYELELTLDNEKEHFKIDLHTNEFNISSTLRKKYKLTINSDVFLKSIQVADNKLFEKPNHITFTRSATCYLPQDKYNLDIYVEDTNCTVGYCKRLIDLNGDTNISIQWCKLSIDTNAKRTTCAHADISNSDYLEVTGKGIFNQYIARGDTYTLKYYLSTNHVTERIYTNKEASLKLRRKWKDVILNFKATDLQTNKDLRLKYYIDQEPHFNKFYDETILEDYEDRSLPYHPHLDTESIYDQRSGTTTINNESKILVSNLSYGHHFIFFRPNNEKYKYNYMNIYVDDKTNEVHLKVFSELTDKVKWNWLRTLIFYAVWILFLIPIIIIPFIDIIYLFLSGDMNNIISIIACIFSGISSCFIICDYFTILVKKRINIKRLRYFSLLTILSGLFSTVGLELDFGFGNDRWGIFLIPLIIYIIIYFISKFIYNLKIKKWSINETLLQLK